MFGRKSIEDAYNRHKIAEVYKVPFQKFVMDLGRLKIPDEDRNNPDLDRLVQRLIETYKTLK